MCGWDNVLIRAGADVNAVGGFFGNSLKAAAWACNWLVVRTLLDAGADINAPGGAYGSALCAFLDTKSFSDSE
ncbi:unnamed protein product [Clonostachys rosea]|uniref:Uncharacterized protein n=1 Tax=Bionectria ochroleuca TaxID=29856 RepID=A0ABY6V483_BIOOC|nr:unnamed protein product [Clonostachys rosea]